MNGYYKHRSQLKDIFLKIKSNSSEAKDIDEYIQRCDESCCDECDDIDFFDYVKYLITHKAKLKLDKKVLGQLMDIREDWWNIKY